MLVNNLYNKEKDMYSDAENVQTNFHMLKILFFFKQWKYIIAEFVLEITNLNRFNNSKVHACPLLLDKRDSRSEF